MKLSEQLQSSAVMVRYPQRSKAEVIQDLVRTLCDSYGLPDQDKVLEAVLAREELVTTGVGCGLAVPHGKLQDIEKMYMAAAVCPEGIDFQSQDCEPARLLFLILSPETTVGPHIRALSCISRLISDASVRSQLVAAENSEQFMALLKQAEENYI